ncbi:fibronectin type III domain-containing protein [Leptospira wolffii]|uniref:fibronectin type III domain-containing protein n=1 Tax=Leptospira wolffii TaxID=409998 RepID=UPI000352F7B8|nr:fibronectin type III domain-containing protein [Leptospira wolffii]EPG67606.1 hypothetical protein LEP1GSC061_0863 [Leptospira wolffii serovar Khorat str. Khorat-H2]
MKIKQTQSLSADIFLFRKIVWKRTASIRPFLIVLLFTLFFQNCFLNPIFKPFVFPEKEAQNFSFLSALFGGGGSNHQGGSGVTPVIPAGGPLPGGGGSVGATSGGYSSQSGATVNLSWAAASDDVTAADSLVYQVYYSTNSQDIYVNTAEALTSGGASAYGEPGANMTSASISGLAASTTYYFNILVRDQDQTASIYNGRSILTEGPDTVQPVPGNNGAFTAVVGSPFVNKYPVTLTWTAATDNVTSQANLVYEIYYDIDNNNNFGNIASIRANGVQAMAPTANVTQYTVYNLSANAMYMFVILVSDEAGNTWLYNNSWLNYARTPYASFIFDSLVTVRGDIGNNRAAANSACISRKNAMNKIAYPWKSLCNTMSLISLPDGTWLNSYISGAQQTPGSPILGTEGLIIANNMTELLFGNLQNTIRSALPEYSSINGWWSFSDANGHYSLSNCLGGTSNFPSDLGTYGDPDSTDYNWFSLTDGNCDIPRAILCICL